MPPLGNFVNSPSGRIDTDDSLNPSCFGRGRGIAGVARSSTGAVHPGSGTQAPATAARRRPPPPRRWPRTRRPGTAPQQRVEEHIKQLHSQLRITAAEEPQWDQFANVMRENARDMDQEFSQRAQQYQTMNALQNMQSYEQIAEAHAQHLQQLVPAFENLYNAMPAQQKQLTDRVFRANAESQRAEADADGPQRSALSRALRRC